LGPALGERRPDDDAGHLVGGALREQPGHGEALSGAAGEGGERLGQHLGLVGEGEADALLAPVHTEESSRRRQGHPCDIVAKNSTLVLVRFIRSSRNSIASTGGMSARKLRSR